MERNVDIHKAAGVLIQNRKLLITRQSGKDFFVAPGGRVEAGESVPEALIRELKEEVSIDVEAADIESFGTFYAPAAGEDNKYLQSDIFFVKKWIGEIVPSAEVEEVQWVNSTIPKDFKLGSIFMHDVLPALKNKGLID